MPVSASEASLRIELHPERLTEILGEIRAMDFDTFRQSELAQVEERNAAISQFICEAFADTRIDTGEDAAYQGMAGMLAAHHILRICSTQPLPLRSDADLTEAIKIMIDAQRYDTEGQVSHEGEATKPSIIAAVDLFSNKSTRRGAELMFRVFDEIIAD